MATMTSLAISLYPPKSTTTHSPYPHPICQSIGFSTSISELGSQWNGLRFTSITVSKQFHAKERKRSGCRGNVVFASLFGVGAPEALVIGVVALLVFGPKGLAEVARNLGKTLRAFQPTIRELQDVSREFKSTLEREIGLDDIANPVQNYNTPTTPTPPPSPTSRSSSDTLQTPVEFNGSPSPRQAYTSEEYLKVTEEQLKASAAAAWQQEQVSSTAEDQIVSQQKQSESIVEESTLTTLPPSPTTPKGDTSS